MPDQSSTSCASCGLWRICFPGRTLHSGAPLVPGVRIRRVRVARGHRLHQAGERLESLCMVRSGCIKEIDGPAGSRAVINFCLPGEILGLQGLGQGRHASSAIAVENSAVCFIPWSSFFRLSRQSPAAGQECMRLLGAAALSARHLLSLVRDRDALGRLAGFLLDLSARVQARGLNGRDIRLAMNRDDIAQYLGLSSETVSRAFTELARRGLLAVRAKRVQLLREGALARLSQPGCDTISS